MEDFSPDKNAPFLPASTVAPFIAVRTGQQVEVIDSNLHSLPEYCLVRVINPQDLTASNASSEGIVPLYCLRLPPRTAAFTSKSISMEVEGNYQV